MSEAGAEEGPLGGSAAKAPSPFRSRHRTGRWVGLGALLVVVSLLLNTILSHPTGASGIPVGTRVPPFAVPLAAGSLVGDADVASKADDGAAGKVPACRERGGAIMNVCQLYERAPLVLALFIDGGSCGDVLGTMARLAPAFPAIRFAAVSIGGNRGQVRELIRAQSVDFPVGIDEDGALAGLYKLGTCPQVSFVGRGGVVVEKPLLAAPSASLLRARIAVLANRGTASRGLG